MTQTTPTAQQSLAEIKEAKDRRDAIALERERAAKRLEAEELALAKHNERIAASQKRIREQEEAERKAELDLRRAQANVMPDTVTRDVAIEVAETLLAAFETYRTNPEELAGQVLSDFGWDAIDAARDRLLTTEVADDATLITLAVEGVISATERWEAACSGMIGGAMAGSVESLGPHPIGNRRVETLEGELRSIIDGAEPKKMESIGRLISEKIDVNQIARMFGLIEANGASALSHLGQIIDSGCVAQPSYLCVRWHGTLSFEEAWQRRQAWVPRRRKFKSDHYMASSHGSLRDGRRNGNGVASRHLREEEEDLRQRNLAVDFVEGSEGVGFIG